MNLYEITSYISKAAIELQYSERIIHKEIWKYDSTNPTVATKLIYELKAISLIVLQTILNIT